MGRISRDARLAFILMWPHCDDAGRLRASSRALASLLFPFDDDAPKLIERWLVELERERCIIRYQVDGSHYLEVTNFLKHQKIDHPSKSNIPEPREASRGLPEASRNVALDQGKERTKEGNGEDQGKEGCAAPSALALIASPVDPIIIEIPTNRRTETYHVLQSLVSEYADDYPAVNIKAEFLAMRAWSISNPKKRKTADGMTRFFNAWLSKAQNNAGTNGNGLGSRKPESPHRQLARVAADLAAEFRAEDEEIAARANSGTFNGAGGLLLASGHERGPADSALAPNGRGFERKD